LEKKYINLRHSRIEEFAGGGCYYIGGRLGRRRGVVALLLPPSSRGRMDGMKWKEGWLEEDPRYTRDFDNRRDDDDSATSGGDRAFLFSASNSLE